MDTGKLRKEDHEIEIGPNVFYVHAFLELNTCRPSSFSGPSPIPFTSIVEYAKLFGLVTTSEIEEFLYIIRKLDRIYLEKTNGNGNKTNSNKSSQ